MHYKKIILPVIALILVAGFENCRAKSCDTASNVNESRKRMKTSNGVFSKKEQRRMKR